MSLSLKGLFRRSEAFLSGWERADGVLVDLRNLAVRAAAVAEDEDKDGIMELLDDEFEERNDDDAAEGWEDNAEED